MMKEILANWYASEKEKMSEMDRAAKLDYVFTYYKGWFLAAIILLAALIWLPWHFFFGRVDVSFCCAMVNGYLKTGDAELTGDLEAYFGFSSRKEQAYFDSGYQILYPGVENDAADTSCYEKFFLNIRTGALNVAIVPESYMEYCNSIGRMFYDVTEALDDAHLEEYRDFFVAGKDAEGAEYMCGIDVSHLGIWEHEEFTFVGSNAGERIILVFPYQAGRPELNGRLLDFLESR